MNTPLNRQQVKELPKGFTATTTGKTRRERRELVNNGNLVRQVVKGKDGNPDKSTFHPKKFHAPQYANLKEAWRAANVTKKPKMDNDTIVGEAA